jgi:small-conductance mechanosensitive channel
MDQLTAWVTRTFSISQDTLGKIVSSLAAILLLWIVRRLLLALAHRRIKDPKSMYRLRKVSTYITVGFAVVIVGRVWFAWVQSIATFFGLLSAGLAIALRDLVVNLAGWGFILIRRPFEVGDRIQIGNQAGDVIDIRIFQFTLMEIGNWVDAEQSTGRILHVPNGKVLSEVLANYSKAFEYIWNEIPVLVTFESNWRKAKKLLEQIADEVGRPPSTEADTGVQRASQRFLIAAPTLTPIVYTSVVDSGVLLTLRYLCLPKQRRGTTQQVWEAILDTFGECEDIDFAYPSQRVFYNAIEGKPGARANPTAAPPFTTDLPVDR